ncbi:MAG: AAA family ATPase [Acetobacteraceae bacterium]|nr:AAA family ATPase [Acetobacteraceae bacterium]
MKEMLAGAGLAVVAFLLLQGYNLLPFLFMAGVAYVLIESTALRGSGRFAPQQAEARRRVTFDDIGGQATAKKELIEALDLVRQRDRLSRLGIRPLKGILLSGPPGTGKTLMAKAAANYTRSSFLAASGSEFVEVYAGVGAQRVRELFTRARREARSAGHQGAVVFLDEIEVMAGQRGRHSSHLEYDQTLNQLLVEMDGLAHDHEGRILVIGATNRIDLLDPALLRPGRFDRVVRVGMPDREGRLHILKLHTRNKPLDPDVDLEALARESFGFSGAHLESVANEAAILAMREGLERISQRHLLEAADKVAMGERIDRRPGTEELRRVAIHELGHALASEVLRPGSVSAITITSRGEALGYVRQSQEQDPCLFTRQRLEEEIQLLLAGAAAEELLLGGASTGASSDFERAAQIARRIVLQGLSPLGVVDGSSLPRKVMHRSTRRILARQGDEARRLVGLYRGLIEEACGILLERESMEGEDLRRRLRQSLPSEPAASEERAQEGGAGVPRRQGAGGPAE